jgi:hypothetical protein
MCERLGQQFPLIDLLEHVTVRQQARHLATLGEPGAARGPFAGVTVQEAGGQV